MAQSSIRWKKAVAMGFIMAAVPGEPAAGEDTPVDLELVLAVDVSGSMDEGERALQRSGYVGAFQHPEVIAAISSGVYGRIAVTYVEWAGPKAQAILIPWRLIDGEANALAFAAALTAAPTWHIHGTSISGALAFASTLFGDNGFAGARLAIDVSGDGPNNMGPPVVPVRDAVVAKGVTINGLPLTLHASPWSSAYGGLDARLLDIYYQDCVIGGLPPVLPPLRGPRHRGEATPP